MGRIAAITVNRSRDEVERLWGQQGPGSAEGIGAVSFAGAPGDRGTEIVVEIDQAGGGKLASVVDTVSEAARRARVKDHLRRFKQIVETGSIARSDGTPEGEHAGGKLVQRPAQPLDQSDLEEVSA
jgi:uncharacterized membrane protein